VSILTALLNNNLKKKKIEEIRTLLSIILKCVKETCSTEVQVTCRSIGSFYDPENGDNISSKVLGDFNQTTWHHIPFTAKKISNLTFN
jgi:hypothetical protein